MFFKKKPHIIKSVFLDIILLYKNFVNWNISKFLFLLYGALLALISVLPFILIYYIYIKSVGGDFSVFLTYLVNNILFEGNVFGYIIHILCWILGMIVFAFYYILLIRLNNFYLKGQKIPILKLDFWKGNFLNFRLIGKYILLTLLICLIFLVPIVAMICIFALFVYLFGGIDAVYTLTSTSGPTDFWVILSAILLVLLLLILFYLFYRLIFSYFVLLEEPKKGIINLLKESFKKTKGFNKLLSFLTIFCIVGILLLPFNIIGNNLSATFSRLEDYKSYMPLGEQEKEYLKSLTMANYYEDLELNFTGKTLEEIADLSEKYFVYIILFQIFKFLFLEGVFVMALSSFYFHKIKE